MGNAMQLIDRIVAWAVFTGIGALVLPAGAQQNLDGLKQRCDGYGFTQGTPEHADCVRMFDAQQVRLRCQTCVSPTLQRGLERWSTTLIGCTGLCRWAGTQRVEKYSQRRLMPRPRDLSKATEPAGASVNTASINSGRLQSETPERRNQPTGTAPPFFPSVMRTMRPSLTRTTRSAASKKRSSCEIAITVRPMRFSSGRNSR